MFRGKVECRTKAQSRSQGGMCRSERASVEADGSQKESIKREELEAKSELRLQLNLELAN